MTYLLPLFFLLIFTSPEARAQQDVLLATTTSVRDAGLLDHILPSFREESGYTVKVVAVGSGQAMALGRRGEADILILHAPAAEERFVAAGYGIERRPLMRNSFVLVGPADDPLNLSGIGALAALRAIATSEARWLSRGDSSGTHFRELLLWRRAGIEPSGEWYLESGQGMGATLVIAGELRAHTLADIGTFLAHRAPFDLAILVEHDSLLANPYHVMLANPERFPRVNVEAARALWRFLLSEETQRRIGAFRREEFGRPLFVPGR